MGSVYEPKNKTQATQMMALHRNMGDGIVILEEDNDDEAQP